MLVSNQSLYMNGNLTVSNGSFITYNTSDLYINGSLSVYNGSINSNSSFEAYGDVSVYHGDLYLNQFVAINGTVSVTNGSIYYNGTMVASGNITLNGTISSANGSLTVNGTVIGSTYSNNNKSNPATEKKLTTCMGCKFVAWYAGQVREETVSADSLRAKIISALQDIQVENKDSLLETVPVLSSILFHTPHAKKSQKLCSVLDLCE